MTIRFSGTSLTIKLSKLQKGFCILATRIVLQVCTYTQVCAFLNYVQSFQFATGKLSRIIQVTSMHLITTWSAAKKGFNTSVNERFQICHKFAKFLKTGFYFECSLSKKQVGEDFLKPQYVCCAD